MTDILMTVADVAELKAHRARVRRNSERRTKRAYHPGSDWRAMNTRQAAYGALYAEAGTVTLADLDYVAKLHKKVLEEAVTRLVENEGYSWAMVGQELGITRQSAQERFGHVAKSRRRSGGQPAELRA